MFFKKKVKEEIDIEEILKSDRNEKEALKKEISDLKLRNTILESQVDISFKKIQDMQDQLNSKDRMLSSYRFLLMKQTNCGEHFEIEKITSTDNNRDVIMVTIEGRVNRVVYDKVINRKYPFALLKFISDEKEMDEAVKGEKECQSKE
ncbi:MAG: hypothetical protein KA467_00205 [Bacteroidales bacterium]|nr:hypothetical protein [Bacteroidales bacterium]